jgi:hypothetical protein
MNYRGGYYGNALQAATRFGYWEIRQLLLDNGALETPDEDHSEGDYEEEPFNVEDDDSQKRL